jgi:VWFA-related protein
MHKVALLLAASGLVASAFAADLAVVRFQVSSPKGQPVTDLRSEEIEIREDGAPQRLELFEGGTDAPRKVPAHIAFLFDCSGTAFTVGALDPQVFFKNLLDEHAWASVSIYGFSGGLARYAAATRDPARLRKALESPYFPHPSSMFLLEDIGRTVADLASHPGPAVRLLVVVSDALGDAAPTSNTARQERYAATVRVAQNVGASLYPVLLREAFGLDASTKAPAASPTSGQSQAALRSAGEFTNLADATGGRKFEVLKGTNLLAGVLKSIAGEIRDDYVAGFLPSASTPPRQHKIQVVLRDKGRGRIQGGVRTLVH